MSFGFSTGQADLAFPVIEVTPGTPVVPAGTDVLRLIGEAEVQQGRMTAESLERVNSLDITDLIALRYDKGTFKLPFYGKRTGTVDTAVPSIDTLLKNALGIKTTNAGVSIVYSELALTTTLTNFTLFYQKGGMGLQCAGCFVNELGMNVEAGPNEAAVFRYEAAGEFYQMRWAGRSVTTEDASVTAVGLTKVKVAAADLAPSDHATVAVVVAGKYCIGSYIKVGALTTSHKITDINPTTGVITFTPALGSDQLSGSVVSTYMPTESEAGDPISSHKGLVTYGGANYANILQMGVKHSLPRHVIVNMKNNLDYPSVDALDGKRRVVIDPMRAYFDPNGTPQQDLFRALADRLTQKAIVINIGNETGYKWQMNFPQAITQEPHLVGDGIVEINMKQHAIASASLNDSFGLTSF